MKLVLRTALTLSLMLPLAACGGGQQKNSQSTTVNQPATNAKTLYAGDKAPKPNCGAVQAVWVNTKTHVYHEPGDPYYGRTANGKYMCPSAAKAEGDRRSRGAMSNGSE